MVTWSVKKNGGLALFVVLLGVMIAGYSLALHYQYERDEHIIQEHFGSISQLYDFSAALAQFRNDHAKAGQADIPYENTKSLEGQLEALVILARNIELEDKDHPKKQELIDLVVQAQDRAREIYQEAKRVGGKAESVQSLRKNFATSYLGAIPETLSTLYKISQEKLLEDMEQREESIRTTDRYVVFFAICSLILALTWSWMLSRALNAPINALSMGVRNFEKTTKLPVFNDPMFDTLANSFREMYENLQKKEEQASRAYKSGFAEQSVAVLHNIGNVITPSLITVETLIEKSSLMTGNNYLDRICSELKKSESDLSAYVRTQRGQEIVQFLYDVNREHSVWTKEIDAMLHKVGKDLSHIAQIIDMQKKYSQMQSPHAQFKVQDALEEAAGVVQSKLRAKNITHTADLSKVSLYTDVDRVKFVQLLVNVYTNAIDAIAQRHKTGGSIETKLITDEKFFTIFITDNGVGIDPSIQKQLFRFGFTTKPKGSGIGLHDCGNFVARYKGRIELTSLGKDQGCTASISLPLLKEG